MLHQDMTFDFCEWHSWRQRCLGSMTFAWAGCLFGDSPGSLPRAKTYVGVRIKSPLMLSDFGQNWKVLANFSKTPHYLISCKSFQQFLSCYMVYTDGRTDKAKLIGSFL
jgi:hypothetical protein